MPAYHYTELDLWCDNMVYHAGEYTRMFPVEITGASTDVCVNKARKAGWIITETDTICPKCVKRNQK